MAIIDYNNGTATISINGGQAPFSYLLLQNGTAVTHPGVNFQNPIVSSNNSVVFGDASDLTGSYGISSGTYTCQITDDLGCVVTTSEIVVGQTQEATTTTLATTPATTLLQEYISLTVDQSPVNEGLNVLFTLTSSNIPNNTMVDWSISGSIDSNDISGGLAGTFTIVNNQAQYLATIETDNLLEGQEELTLTLAAIDTNGISAGLSVDVIINDMNTAATTLATNATTIATNATTEATDATTEATTSTTLATTTTTLATTSTTTAAPGYLWAPYGNPNNENNGIGNWVSNDEGTTYQWQLVQAPGTGTIPAGQQIWWRVDSIAISGQPASPSDFSGGVFPTGNFVTQTAGTVGNSNTVALWSVTIESDMTTEPVEQYDMKLYTDSTYTTELELHGIAQNYVRVNINDTSQTPTTTIAPVEYELITAYLNRDEGQSAFFELQYTNGTPGTTVGFTLSGTAAPAFEMGGMIEPMDYTEPTDMFFTVGTSGFVILEIPINEDQQTEGTETIILTLDAQDSDGNPTGSLQKTVTINDTSELPDWEIIASTHDEGITFNHILNTEHVPAGTEYFWSVSVAIGYPWTPASAADFVGGVVPSGSGTVPAYNETLSQSAVIPISIVADSLTEGDEVYQIIVREGSESGPIREITMMTITDTSVATTSTTLATTTTTQATTTSAPENLYWFHTGEATWPYSKDLMSNDPQYFPPDGTNQSNSTPKFKQTFADMLNNPSGYEAVNSTQQFNTGTQLAFDASIGSSYYWILIPDSMGIPDLTQNAGLADTQNNTSDVAHSKMAMEVGGNPYTLYRVNLLSSISAVTIEYTL